MAKKRKVEQEAAVKKEPAVTKKVEVAAKKEEVAKKKEEVAVEKEEVETKKREEEEDEEEVEEDEEDEDEEGEGTGNENGEAEDDGIKKLLEPFTKDQLIEILQGLASKDAEILEEIRKKADKDTAHRKIFVRGLGWNTTSQSLQSVFSKYGELEECTVIMDKASSKSKGYGFVTFTHMAGARRALKEPSKKIDGRMTACQMASAGPPAPNPPSEQQTGRKIYVGNVPADVSADKLLNVFSKYGEIEEGPLGFDKQTGKSRGFALFIYKTVEGAKRALEEPNKNVDGHTVHCKRAASVHKQKNSRAAASAPLDPNDLALTHGTGSILGSAGGQGVLGAGLSFNQGANPGFNQTFNAILAGQNPNLAGLNPSVLASLNPSLASSLNQSSLSQSFPQASYGTVGSYGGHPSLGSYGSGHPSLGSYGSQLGSLNPGVLGVYGSQAAALQGLTAYQNPQQGQSSGPRTSQGSSYLPH